MSNTQIRFFCLVLLFGAFALNLLSSVSLPFLHELDVTRTTWSNEVKIVLGNETTTIKQIRFGVWSACYYDLSTAVSCLPKGYAYSVHLQNALKTRTVTIAPSWTRGLAVHPVATVATILAFLLACIPNSGVVTTFASGMSFLAATLSLIAFAIDIALFAWVQDKANRLGAAHTVPRSAFWLTFTAMLLLFFSGILCRRTSSGKAAAEDTGRTRWLPWVRK